MSLCDGVPGRSFAGIALSRADSVIIVVESGRSYERLARQLFLRREEGYVGDGEIGGR